MSEEDIEEYLEAIFDIASSQGTAKTTEIAKRLNKAPASVTEALQRMAAKGLVHYESHKGAALTLDGLSKARHLKRRHRLVEVFLNKVLKSAPEKVHEEACKMEHAISDDTADALCRFLHGPGNCPHGSLIPPCDTSEPSCEICLTTSVLPQSRKIRKRDIIPITSLKPGQKSIVSFIRGGKTIVKRLSDLGLTPKSKICLIRTAPLHGPVEVCTRGCNIVIGRNIADQVFVEARGI